MPFIFRCLQSRSRSYPAPSLRGCVVREVGCPSCRCPAQVPSISWLDTRLWESKNEKYLLTLITAFLFLPLAHSLWKRFPLK